MTTEEILAECPELEIRFNMLGLVNFSHHVKPKGDIEIISNEVASAWAQARKEARELRELLQLILPTLYGENYMLVSNLLEKHRSNHD